MHHLKLANTGQGCGSALSRSWCMNKGTQNLYGCPPVKESMLQCHENTLKKHIANSRVS